MDFAAFDNKNETAQGHPLQTAEGAPVHTYQQKPDFPKMAEPANELKNYSMDLIV